MCTGHLHNILINAPKCCRESLCDGRRMELIEFSLEAGCKMMLLRRIGATASEIMRKLLVLAATIVQVPTMRLLVPSPSHLVAFLGDELALRILRCDFQAMISSGNDHENLAIRIDHVLAWTCQFHTADELCPLLPENIGGGDHEDEEPTCHLQYVLGAQIFEIKRCLGICSGSVWLLNPLDGFLRHSIVVDFSGPAVGVT